MTARVPSFVARDMQKAIRNFGQDVDYVPADGSAVLAGIRARVRYVGAAELANAVEAYPLEVTLDASDFEAREPRKGDSMLIDGGRRGVMLVREIRISGILIGYRCGVQG